MVFEETREAKDLKIDLLILTAVPVEREAVLARLKPFPSKTRVLKINEKRAVYHAGLFGSTRAVVAMCSAGSGGRDGSHAAASRAIRNFSPVAVVMLGIAFGTNPKKTAIGDVLVSDHVVPYEPQRKGAQGDISRGVPAKSGQTLLSRFKSAIGWRFVKPDGVVSKYHIGPLLSGEKLVDNVSFRDELQEIAPEALGGEMEAWGLFSAAENEGVEWIVVKGICDWADGSKEKTHQPVAAAAAVDLAVEVFSDATALSAIGGTEPSTSKQTSSEPSAFVSSVAILALIVLLAALSIRWQLGYFPSWSDFSPPKSRETEPVSFSPTPSPTAPVQSPTPTATPKAPQPNSGSVYCRVKVFNPEVTRKPTLGVYFRGDLVIRNQSKKDVQIKRLAIGLADSRFKWIEWIDQRPPSEQLSAPISPGEVRILSFETSAVDVDKWKSLVNQGKSLNGGEKFILPVALAIKTTDGRDRVGFLEVGELEVMPTGDILSWSTSPEEFSLIPGATSVVMAQLPNDF